MSESFLTYHKDGSAAAFVGPQGVDLFRAAMLASGLRMYARSGMLLTRGLTISAMLLHATAYTGKTYKRGQAAQAAEDVSVFVSALKSSLPIKERADAV